MSVKSVYNFVPAPRESEVFKPDWVGKVSHDIPFEDGESGEIEIKITAKTPIFIRNGHSKQDAEDNTKRYQEFSNVVRNGEKEYFIPGSSIKGMFRNVLEIVSKSRMSRIDDKRHAVRQIMRTDGVVVNEGYELADDEIKKTIKAGWLLYKNGKYFIYDTGRPLKIRNTDLDKITDNAFTKNFSKSGLAKIADNFSSRTAKYKYEKVINADNLVHKFEDHPLDENDKQNSWVSKFQKLNYVRVCDESQKNGFYGHIVCAGQAAEYDVKTARKGEYVFKGKKEDVLSNSRNSKNLSNAKFDDFLFLNRTGKSDELEDWGYWKDKIEEGIPVFYRADLKDKDTILDFGLTFMYKQFAKNTVKDMEPKYLIPEDLKYELDFADTLFGTTDGENTIKGRVMFSTCKLENEASFSGVRKVVLSTPRSSYFPYYIKQKSNGQKTASYNTYNTGGELNGFKRYPIRSGNNIYKQKLDEISDEMKTIFNPLNEGAVFNGVVKFHNLRKSEIGALLSAITMHDSKGLFHSIGYAKPLGYGKIQVDSSIKELKFSIDEYMKEFELLMLANNPKWEINELLSMANENSNPSIKLEYTDLKEFQEYKNEGGILQKYSSYSKVNSKTHFKNNDQDLELHKNEQEKENKEKENKRIEELKLNEEKLKLKQEEADKPYNELIGKGDALFTDNNWVEAMQKYLAAIEIKPEEQYPKQQKNKCNDKISSKLADLSGVSKINDFKKGKPIVEKYFKALNGNLISDEVQIEILKGFIQRCFIKSNKRWKKKGKQDWVLIKKWLGEETAQQWYDEISKK